MTHFSSKPSTTDALRALMKKRCGRTYIPRPELHPSIARIFKKNFTKTLNAGRLNRPNKPLRVKAEAYLQSLEGGKDPFFEKNIAICDIGQPAGLGVFAKHKIPKGTLIGIYAGEIVKYGKAHFDGAYAFKAIDDNEERDSFQWLTKYDIDAAKKGSWTCLINASADHPNVEVVGRYDEQGPLHFLITIKSIPAKTQLFYDYGPEYWTDIVPLPLPPHFDDYPHALQLL